MALLIEKPGILTTIQDLGRPGYRRFGINPGGAMDRQAVRLLNILVGNDENEGVLEMHFPAAQIVFESACIFAVGGADFTPKLDGRTLTAWQPTFARAGVVLKFNARTVGNRSYLAVAGGFDLERWLGSSSTNLAANIGGFGGRPLEAGDRLPITRGAAYRPRSFSSVSASLLPRYSRFPTVRAIAGAEFALLNPDYKSQITRASFEVTNRSDRMGFRLAGPDLHLNGPLEIVSSAVDFGTVQLLPDGQLIVLMAESQTAGGYARLAHIVSVDLPVVAQLGPGDKLRFHLIDQQHAEEVVLAAEGELNFFRVGCRLQAQMWTS